jgi:hypothetical protein
MLRKASKKQVIAISASGGSPMQYVLTKSLSRALSSADKDIMLYPGGFASTI